MTQHIDIQKVEELILPLLKDDIFLVSIKIKPISNIKVYLDADKGLSIEKCIAINRALYKIIEEKNIYPNGDFSLEISSPGVEEPLKLIRQYKKNVGRDIEIIKNDNHKMQGKLINATGDMITIEYTEGKGKKAMKKYVDLEYTEIKQTKVQVKI